MSDITLGIIGSGQLGSLLCQAAKKLSIKTVVISDDEQGPAQNYSNEFIYSEYNDENKRFTPEEISAMILTEMKQVAQAYLGEDIKDAVIRKKFFIRENTNLKS